MITFIYIIMIVLQVALMAPIISKYFKWKKNREYRCIAKRLLIVITGILQLTVLNWQMEDVISNGDVLLTHISIIGIATMTILMYWKVPEILKQMTKESE